MPTLPPNDRRPARPDPAALCAYALGIDLGGTNVKYRLAQLYATVGANP